MKWSLGVSGIIHGRVRTIVSWTVFVVLLTTYWITTPTTVSYWDCPEYVTAAYLLEVGHPPGNPLWMLVERIVASLAPTPLQAAYFINLSSGLFTAFACLFLCRVIFQLALWLLRRYPARGISPIIGASVTALIGSLCFGWCDSTWFSAVEAEVYAMSIFFTCLALWLMVKWAFTHDPLAGNRLLVLIAYIMGLSLGVHQLNLLCIPALALIWCLRRGVRNKLLICGIILVGMAGVGLVLIGIMPSSIEIAANLELLCVNTFHLPYLSGVIAYLILLGLALLLSLWATSRQRQRGFIAVAIFPAIFLSGIFCFGHYLLIGATMSALVSILIMRSHGLSIRRLHLLLWMLGMLLCGYGSYALIPVRGFIPSPANPTMPGEPFSFAAYQAREQYGGAPLLYGPTPMSKPLYKEEYLSDGKTPVYRHYALQKGRPYYAPDPDGEGYKIKGYHLKNLFAPQLNNWFPRVHSRDPRDLESYKSWAGMDTASMAKVAIDYAVDSLGRPVMKKDANGEIDTIYSYRPVFIHNLRTLFGYQIGYMYFRYLMWNFCGRQNDIHSQGEVEHGNFITGITPIDNLMLGAEDKLPAYMGRENAGRNRYFGIPLLLGVIGLIWLLFKGKRGRAIAAVTFLLFFMSGIAITIYLNQAPGEPRERDYSFLGSYAAFAIWIGFGALALARLFRSKWILYLLMGVPIWMCVENFDDHDRRGRNVATNFAVDMLKNLEPDAIIFVNGDNYTFPLWYVQEVLGVRKDVRVVNLAYLNMASYTANLFKEWRESPAINTILDSKDIFWDRYRLTRISPMSKDTVDAAQLLSDLQQSDTTLLNARYARVPLPGDKKVTLDLRILSGSGRDTSVKFGKLMMLDIIASNPGRPIYWISALRQGDRLGIADSLMSERLFSLKLGYEPSSQTLDELEKEALLVTSYNDRGRKVYMDPTPAKLLGHVRSRLVLTARKLMEDGRADAAERVLDRADILLGDNMMSFNYVSDGDSIIDVRKELGRLQLALADSLLQRGGNKGRVLELKSRGRYNMQQADKRKEDFKRYRQSLPPRLRHFTVPLS